MKGIIEQLLPLYEERNKLNNKIWELRENFDGDTSYLMNKLKGKSLYFPLFNSYLINVTDVVYDNKNDVFTITAEKGYELWDDENILYVRCFICRITSESVPFCVIDPYDNECYARYEISDKDTIEKKILDITKFNSIEELDSKIDKNKNVKYFEVDYDEE